MRTIFPNVMESRTKLSELDERVQPMKELLARRIVDRIRSGDIVCANRQRQRIDADDIIPRITPEHVRLGLGTEVMAQNKYLIIALASDVSCGDVVFFERNPERKDFGMDLLKEDITQGDFQTMCENGAAFTGAYNRHMLAHSTKAHLDAPCGDKGSQTNRAVYTNRIAEAEQGQDEIAVATDDLRETISIL